MQKAGRTSGRGRCPGGNVWGNVLHPFSQNSTRRVDFFSSDWQRHASLRCCTVGLLRQLKRRHRRVDVDGSTSAVLVSAHRPQKIADFWSRMRTTSMILVLQPTYVPRICPHRRRHWCRRGQTTVLPNILQCCRRPSTWIKGSYFN